MPSIPSDVLAFLEGYPEQEDDPELYDNLKFYSNKLRCRPDRLLVDELHEQWQGDYQTLEFEHGFIQWLFPLQEHGMNYQSQALQRHEIESMKTSPDIMGRILTSYRLMLDFYGMRLTDPDSGLLDRALPPRNVHSRYRNLVRSSHNYLRITRILKCLSEFGLETLNAGFLLFVLNEQSEHDELNTAGLRSSMDRWWAHCIRDECERRFVRQQIDKVRQSDAVWTRQLYENALRVRKDTGRFEEASINSDRTSALETVVDDGLLSSNGT